ncbi:50S ribosomal protein L15 [Flexithrix dorotheae]|uniref:50S ribosomal protein L15 n=1 Tax=Flexithrix dorotheae TaxID=70993 RepID=UPI00037D46CE|nr:50S ribosomal protein L15 [Flexithrix dorotheae]
MKLHSLKPAEGSVKNRKRIGRGPGSGKGGTSARGHKGAKSRSGYSRKLGFEGGQMPLQRRVPKFGFRSPFRVEYKPINVGKLQELSEKHNLNQFEVADFVKFGLASKNDKIKVLGNGELNVKLDVTVHAYSSSAKTAIENAGGNANTL